MFAGHFAPAIAAAAHKDAPSLPVLFVGAQLVDWAFFGFAMADIEHLRIVPGFTAMNPMDLYDMPWTHSLLGSMGWAALFVIIVRMMGIGRTGQMIGGGVVLSHWLLDWVAHAPDLTLYGAPPKMGLGLWNHPSLEMPLEIALVLGSLWFLHRKTGLSLLRLAALGVLLLIFQAVNWFGEQPVAVTTDMLLLPWVAYGVATLAAWWAVREPSRRDQLTVQ